MTNPDNIVRVRARNGGRASVYEANGWAQAYSSGLLEGHGVTQNTSADMNVLVGGSQTKPDVVLAENPAGYRIALDLVGQQAVAITAPATNSRISAIVAYTDDLSLTTTEDTVTGSPASCGLIVVNGTASVSPTAPTDNEIRTAITADGATGSQAAYAIIATVEVANDATVITNSLITKNNATIAATKLDFSTFNRITVTGSGGDVAVPIHTTISLPNISTNIGTGFTQSGNYIVIGSGIKTVRVSANVFYWSSGGAYGWARVNKNDTDTGINSITNLANSSYGSVVISPRLLSVSEGDKISLYNNASGVEIRGNSCWMTIEAVE